MAKDGHKGIKEANFIVWYVFFKFFFHIGFIYSYSVELGLILLVTFAHLYV